MNENEPDLVEQLHREAVERRREEKAKERALVEAVFREFLERHRAEQRRVDALLDQIHQEAATHPRPVPPAEPATVHYTELCEAKPDSPLYHEWNTYRRAVGQLLADGHAGRHVLIKGEQIIGIWDTHDEAMTAGYHRFLGQPFLVHQIQERERVLRCVTMHLWRNSPSPFHRAS
jgi:hypothetical protein